MPVYLMSLSYGTRFVEFAYRMENEGEEERRRDGRRVPRLDGGEESEGYRPRHGEADCVGREASERRRYILPLLDDRMGRLVTAEIREAEPLPNEEEFYVFTTPCKRRRVLDLFPADEAFYFPCSPSATVA